MAQGQSPSTNVRFLLHTQGKYIDQRQIRKLENFIYSPCTLTDGKRRKVTRCFTTRSSKTRNDPCLSILGDLLTFHVDLLTFHVDLLTFHVDLLTFSCLNLVRILISLNVRWQYVWCSNGEIFLMATRDLFTLSHADLQRKHASR